MLPIPKNILNFYALYFGTAVINLIDITCCLIATKHLFFEIIGLLSLNSRKQRIKIDGHLSDAFQLPYGGSSGLSPEPTLFTLHMTPLSSIISKFNVTLHLYADNTQIYLELDSSNFDSSTTELADCLEAIQAWMGINKLKLNFDKIEFIVIGDDKIRSSMKSSFPVSFLGNIMEPAELVKNLGVILDADNSMQRHYLIYVTHVTTVSRNYEVSEGI